MVVVKDETLVPNVPIRVRALKSDAGITGNDQMLILVLCLHLLLQKELRSRTLHLLSTSEVWNVIPTVL